MKLIIAGSRDFHNFELLEKEVLYFIKHYRKENEIIEIISGNARGADKLGEQFARKYNLKTYLMPADWKTYGKSAGYKRNQDMAAIATHCIIFWNGISPGSKNMFDIADKKNLITKVIEI